MLAGPTDDDGVCTLRGRDMIRILEDEFGVRYELSRVYINSPGSDSRREQENLRRKF